MAKSKLLIMAEAIAKEEEAENFHEHMDGLNGSGEIYEKKYGEMLDLALTGEMDADDIFEVIEPLVTALLIESEMKDKPVFNELMKSIRMAHLHLSSWREEKEFIIDESKDSAEEVSSKWETLHAMGESGHWRVKELDDSKIDSGYVKCVMIRTKQP